MFRKILVGLDGSPSARRALEVAIELAKCHGSDLSVLAVEEHLPAYAATVGEVVEEQAFENGYFATVLADAQELALSSGIRLRTEVLAGHAANVIVRYARSGGFDLIALGHKGHSFVEEFFMGSTSDKVSHHAHCSVLIVK